jgi:hypothetical protein
MAAVVAIVDWRAVWAQQGRDIRLIPLPATWLNGERWEDELPDVLFARPAAQAAAKIPERINGSAMPEHVKALLAKLRNGK